MVTQSYTFFFGSQVHFFTEKCDEVILNSELEVRSWILASHLICLFKYPLGNSVGNFFRTGRFSTII